MSLLWASQESYTARLLGLGGRGEAKDAGTSLSVGRGQTVAMGVDLGHWPRVVNGFLRPFGAARCLGGARLGVLLAVFPSMAVAGLAEDEVDGGAFKAEGFAELVDEVAAVADG